ncbi:MAG TPA: hypothetical protein VFO16_07300, partial [Pseudonocardiaceae bacterium]|nr:hypothetical protein [Pseudonocardiaceae bacterium]
ASFLDTPPRQDTWLGMSAGDHYVAELVAALRWAEPGAVSAMWEPVATAYTQLAATVHPGGEEDAA